VLALLLLPVIAGAPAPLASPDEELVALFDRICLGNEAPGTGFVEVGAEDVPEDAGGVYIGPHHGRYWRRQDPSPAFVALTEGPGHWGGREAYCGVGLTGPSFEAVALTFGGRIGDDTMRLPNGRLAIWKRGGTANVTVAASGSSYSVLVTQRPDNWVSVVTGGVRHAFGAEPFARETE
jgi:hypothetical protein